MGEHKKDHKEEKNNGAGAPQGEAAVTIKEAEYLKLKEDAVRAQEHWDRYLRLQADFENTRKRYEREKQDFVKFANEGVIVELLSILDELERAVASVEAHQEDFPAFLKGVEMILGHLYEMLKGYGVRPIEAKDKLFDPHYHEALMQVVDNGRPEHTVLEELQKGYLLNDRIIRTAKVKVSKKDENKGQTC